MHKNTYTYIHNSAFANASFPMDAAHGFGVPQLVVWNGHLADSVTGDCQEGVSQ